MTQKYLMIKKMSHPWKRIRDRFGDFHHNEIVDAYIDGVYYGLSGSAHIVMSHLRGKIIMFLVRAKGKGRAVKVITVYNERMLTSNRTGNYHKYHDLLHKKPVREAYLQYKEFEGGTPIPERLQVKRCS